MPAFHSWRKIERPEARTHQTAYCHSQSSEHAAHQPVTPFAHTDAIPAIRSLPALHLDRIEARGTVIQRDARTQLAHLLGAQFADQPHRVIASRLIAWVGKPVRQFARVREDQEAASIEVEPPHRQPAAAARRGNAIEHARAAFRITARHDLALRLVIEQDLGFASGGGGRPRPTHELARDCDAVLCAHSRAQLCGLTVHHHLARLDQLFHGSPRAQTRFGEALLQLDCRTVGVVMNEVTSTRRLSARIRTLLLWAARPLGTMGMPLTGGIAVTTRPAARSRAWLGLKGSRVRSWLSRGV